jgi:putative endonuclease
MTKGLGVLLGGLGAAEGGRANVLRLLRCFDGTFYVGVTNDVERRFAEHCEGGDKWSYTRTRGPLRLVHVSEFKRPDEAIAFEKRLKRWNHNKKRAFAEGDWAMLKRLSAGPKSQ